MSENTSKEQFFRKLACNMLSPVEDTLAEYNIKLPDSDRTGAPEEACLYGETYYILEDALTAILNKRFGSSQEQLVNVEHGLDWNPGDKIENDPGILDKVSNTVLNYIPVVLPRTASEIERMSAEKLKNELQETKDALDKLEMRYRLIQAISNKDTNDVCKVLNQRSD